MRQCMLREPNGELASVAERQERFGLGEVKDELMLAMGLNTETPGTALAFLRRGFRVSAGDWSWLHARAGFGWLHVGNVKEYAAGKHAFERISLICKRNWKCHKRRSAGCTDLLLHSCDSRSSAQPVHLPCHLGVVMFPATALPPANILKGIFI